MTGNFLYARYWSFSLIYVLWIFILNIHLTFYIPNDAFWKTFPRFSWKPIYQWSLLWLLFKVIFLRNIFPSHEHTHFWRLKDLSFVFISLMHLKLIAVYDVKPRRWSLFLCTWGCTVPAPFMEETLICRSHGFGVLLKINHLFKCRSVSGLSLLHSVLSICQYVFQCFTVLIRVLMVWMS